ncbi:LPS O-antigen chain length determinant protein WzzB [Cronobacter sakazakii]|uniref:LPS O-antigen chain length determinant protein WzzB n=1 Tax=Cronobacter sakazakii TaxID=28141 RepID=UPI000CF0BDA5|nr:LPS O-antigen chain length determinant protein WzzB [Cronobacter sakazakii]PPX99974.1 LPS O-antigen chain length determinant protein WzzB [Cronobacter sakazakii]
MHTSSTANNRQPDANEQIDLLDLLLQLWRGKLTIAACIVVAILLAVAYLFVAKEKWTSEAIVTLPDSGQIANYNNSMGILYGQNPTNAPTPTVVDVQERFFGRFNSAISALADELQNQPEKESLKIEQTVKGQQVPLTISYTANGAEQAQKTLDKYIQQINKQVVQELDADLQVNIDSKLEDLKASLATQIKVAQEQKDKRLAVLNQALLVAQQANIKDTLVQQAETLSEDTLFVLGSDALSSIIKNEGTRPLPLSDYYYQTRQSLLAVSALKSKPDSLYSFRYVMKPSLPIYRDSPKRALTLILAVLIGGIIGSGVVLLRHAVRNHRPG